LHNNYVFAVNAGSDEVSVLSVGANGLSLADKKPSGGTMPISVTAYNNLLYVLNAGGTGNITGFWIGSDGTLSEIAGSTQPLSSGASGPAQVEFSPDGSLLVVTEKATNAISTYVVDGNGIASGPATLPSAGQTPFGFAFDKGGHIIVSEAFGGGALAGAMSSYNVNAGGASLITGPVFNTQTAPCWVAVTKNGRFAYTTNTGSGNVSGYKIGNDGSLTLFNDGGNTASTGTGSSPLDMAVSNNSQYLYVVSKGTNTISVFRIDNGHGGLTAVETINGLPASVVGLAGN
jgi:6-phosphogluconolactonase (cycloisomerase 2 family)